MLIRSHRWLAIASMLLLARGCCSIALGAGTLVPRDPSLQPLAIRQHHVSVVIDNGYARTQVDQTFFNPNAQVLEARYSFPLPKSAALAEVTIGQGDHVLRGEVVKKEEAQQAYSEEKNAGNDAGLAEKNGYQTFEFSVANVKPQVATDVRIVYYQSIALDTGVGRYVYPLEDNGTDDARQTREPFWSVNDQVEGDFTIEVELKSAYPVEKVHATGFDGAPVEILGDGHVKSRFEQPAGRLNRDFVYYWALQDALPARVEMVPYREDPAKPGTFMLVVTPGVDLKPLNGGADYVFVLDVSGSMESKLSTLARGVERALTNLRAGDRFRIVTFANSAEALAEGFVPATEASVRAAIDEVHSLTTRGGTNIYAGIAEGLSGLDADRATSLLLVTDGVANVGEISPKAFHALLSQFDLRFFGFLMGNGSNWPLMEVLAQASGGTYQALSNSDEIATQLALAKPKIATEALHGVTLKIEGVQVSDLTKELYGKVYRGQQLVLMGRYLQPGHATVELKARLTGEDKVYRAEFDFPEIDAANPELERIFALHRIEQLQIQSDLGLMVEGEAKTAMTDLALEAQIVGDYTSMLVLDDAGFQRRGIERNNARRLSVEEKARLVRSTQPPRPMRVDQNAPMFQSPSASRNSGGAIDPVLLAILAGVALLVFTAPGRKIAP